VKLSEGVYTHSELIEIFGSRRLADAAIATEELTRIAQGLYSNVTNPVTEAMIVLAKRHPEAVVSGWSALLFQRLSDRLDERIFVDVPSETHPRKSPLFHFSRISSARMTGIETRDICGIQARVYSRERCLWEAAKLTQPALYYAVKQYVQAEVDYKELVRLDKIFGGDVLLLVRHECSDASF
jgi:predicted transcriptional regulator of viral defense system